MPCDSSVPLHTVSCIHVFPRGVVHRVSVSYRIPFGMFPPPCAGLVCGGDQWNSFRVRLWGNTSVMNIFVRVSGELTGAHCSWICTWRGILRCYGISGKELLIFGECYWCICIHHSHWRSGGAQLLPISTDALNVSLHLSNPFEERMAVVPKLFDLVCISPTKNYIENLPKCTESSSVHFSNWIIWFLKFDCFRIFNVTKELSVRRKIISCMYVYVYTFIGFHDQKLFVNFNWPIFSLRLALVSEFVYFSHFHLLLFISLF